MGDFEFKIIGNEIDKYFEEQKFINNFKLNKGIKFFGKNQIKKERERKG